MGDDFDFLDDFLQADATLSQVDTSALDNLDDELRPRRGPYESRHGHGRSSKQSKADREEELAKESLEDIRRVAAAMQLNVEGMDTSSGGGGGGNINLMGGTGGAVGVEGVRNLAQNLLNDLDGKSAGLQQKAPSMASAGSQQAFPRQVQAQAPPQQRPQQQQQAQRAPASDSAEMDSLLSELAAGPTAGTPAAKVGILRTPPAPAAASGAPGGVEIDDLLSALASKPSPGAAQQAQQQPAGPAPNQVAEVDDLLDTLAQAQRPGPAPIQAAVVATSPTPAAPAQADNLDDLLDMLASKHG